MTLASKNSSTSHLSKHHMLEVDKVHALEVVVHEELEAEGHVGLMRLEGPS